MDTGICILIFAGAGGHRNEVLSVVKMMFCKFWLLLWFKYNKDLELILWWLLQDFHPSDIYGIASCGMDNTVKIWSMKGRILAH